MEKILNLIETYKKTTVRNRAAHYRAAKVAMRKHMLLGIPVIIMSTIVGTAIFASLNNDPDVRIKITAGLISLAGAVFSALQTFFRFSELAEKHRVAGASYGEISRQLELLSLKFGNAYSSEEAKVIDELTSVCEGLSKLAKESPDIPDAAYKEAVKLESSG